MLQANVDERLADLGRIVDVIVQLNDGAIVTRGDRHVGFVRLNFADLVELLDLITDFHVPASQVADDERAVQRTTDHSLTSTSRMPSPMSASLNCTTDDRRVADKEIERKPKCCRATHVDRDKGTVRLTIMESCIEKTGRLLARFCSEWMEETAW